MRTRRRKRKYTWFPTLGGYRIGSGDNPPTYNDNCIQIVVEPNSDNTLPSVFVTPLIPDATEQAADLLGVSDAGVLRDLTEGQDWFLKRLVGKLFLCSPTNLATGITGNDIWPFVKVACGFFVSRAVDQGEGGVPDMQVAEYDPWDNANVRQPWIWRRTFVFYQPSSIQAQTQHYVGPQTNFTGGVGAGLLDGPHVDIKTARRIRREERLFFAVSAVGARSPQFGFPETKDPDAMILNQIQGFLDYRILGAMRRSNNRSVF